MARFLGVIGLLGLLGLRGILGSVGPVGLLGFVWLIFTWMSRLITNDARQDVPVVYEGTLEGVVEGTQVLSTSTLLTLYVTLFTLYSHSIYPQFTFTHNYFTYLLSFTIIYT